MPRASNSVGQTFKDRKCIYISVGIEIEVSCKVQDIVGCPISVNLCTTLEYDVWGLLNFMTLDKNSHASPSDNWSGNLILYWIMT